MKNFFTIFQQIALPELCNTSIKTYFIAESLGVDHTTVSKHLVALGMIQKQGHRCPYKLKPRDIDRYLVTYNYLLQQQKKKGFLPHIVTSHENIFTTITLSVEDCWVSSAM